MLALSKTQYIQFDVNLRFGQCCTLQFHLFIKLEMITSSSPQTISADTTGAREMVSKACDMCSLKKERVRPNLHLRIVETDLISAIDLVHVNNVKQRTKYVHRATK
jgi:hypothetical protein